MLDFTGRFLFDYFYTGDIYNPQTRTDTLDRYLALSYDGAALSFPRYQEAAVLTRIAKACFDSDPALSLTLAQTAIDRNTFFADAWRVLMQHIADGLLPRKDGAAWGSRLLKDLKNHPDLTIECVVLFLNSIPLHEQVERQRIWNGAYQLYAQRPDLQIALRMVQCAELLEVDNHAEAFARAVDTIVANAKEGALILPLLAYVVESAERYRKTNPRFRIDTLKAALTRAEADFPQMRAGQASEAYTEFRALVSRL
jgi:hypothetical protein